MGRVFSLNIRGFNENASHVRHLARQLLASETDQIRARHHGNIGKTEDEDMLIGHGISDGDGGGDKGPENVDRAG